MRQDPRRIEHTGVLCVDAAGVIARQYHGSVAANGAASPTHQVAGAVGAVRRIANLVAQLRPSYLVIAQDCKREHNRRALEIYDKYKAPRKPPDPLLVRNTELTYQAAGLLGWPLVSAPGLEADDVIASVCAAQDFANDTITIVTSDHDLLALCSDRVTVRLVADRGRYQDCGPQECLEHYGVPPWLVRHYRALVGDKSDSYPGVPGIGEVLGLQVLKACPSVIDLYTRLGRNEEVPGLSRRVVDLLKAGHREAIMSWQLAGLQNNIEIDKASLDIRGTCQLSDVREPLCHLGLSALFGPVSTASPAAVHAGW